MRVQAMLMGWALAALTILASCVGNKDIRLADNLVDRGRYTEALEVYRRCLAADPDNPKIQRRLVETKRLESRRLMTMARTRLEHADYETAFELYADAVRYDPDNREAYQGLETARDRWIAVADQLEQAGDFEDALAIHKRILREFREFPKSVEALRRIRMEQATRFVEKARAFRDRGLPGNALIAYLQARALVPDMPGLQEAIDATIVELEETARLHIGIRHQRGSQFKANLWALFLNGVFEKSQLPMELIPGARDTPYRVELRGRASRVKTVSKPIQASTQVEGGKTRVPNPAYAALEAKVEAAEARVKDLEPKVLALQNRLEALARERIRTGSGTASPEEEAVRKQLAEISGPYREAVAEFRRLSAQLVRIPEYFEKPTYRTETYPARELRRWVRVTGVATILRADGTVVTSVSLDDLIEVRDMAHPALKATATRPAIPEDPVTLPPPRELRVLAESRAMAKLQQALLDLYDEHVDALWQTARRYALDGKSEQATESFLRAFFADPSHPTGEVTRYILEAKQTLSLPLEAFLISVVEEAPEPSASTGSVER